MCCLNDLTVATFANYGANVILVFNALNFSEGTHKHIIKLVLLILKILALFIYFINSLADIKNLFMI